MRASRYQVALVASQHGSTCGTRRAQNVFKEREDGMCPKSKEWHRRARSGQRTYCLRMISVLLRKASLWPKSDPYQGL